MSSGVSVVVRSSSRLRCAYCHADAERIGSETCSGCSTLLHTDCLATLGGCPTLGCDSDRLARAAHAISAVCAHCREDLSDWQRNARICTACERSYHWGCSYNRPACVCGHRALRAFGEATRPVAPVEERSWLWWIPTLLGLATAVLFVVWGVGYQPGVGETFIPLEVASPAQPAGQEPGLAPIEPSLVDHARHLRSGDLHTQLEAGAELAKHGEAAVTVILDEFADDDIRARLKVAPLVERLGEGWPIHDTSTQRRIQAFLTPRNQTEVLDVMTLWNLGDTDVRVSATRALTRAGQHAVRPLVSALQGQNSVEAGHVLEAMGPAVVPALERALLSDQAFEAAYVLEGIGAADALGRILLSSDATAEVRYTAADALGRMGEAALRARPALEQAGEQDWSPTVREAARAAAIRILERERS